MKGKGRERRTPPKRCGLCVRNICTAARLQLASLALFPVERSTVACSPSAGTRNTMLLETALSHRRGARRVATSEGHCGCLSCLPLGRSTPYPPYSPSEALAALWSLATKSHTQAHNLSWLTTSTHAPGLSAAESSPGRGRSRVAAARVFSCGLRVVSGSNRTSPAPHHS